MPECILYTISGLFSAFLVFVIKALHLYDCLRATKLTSAWGVEARVPFLDKEFIKTAMDIDPEWKMVTDSMLMNAAFSTLKTLRPQKKDTTIGLRNFFRSYGQNAARLTVFGGLSVACSTAKAVEWDAEWFKNPDPSGRATLGIRAAAYEESKDVKTGSPVGKGVAKKVAAVV